MSLLDLLDWRRQVSELFTDLRRRTPDEATLAWFRQQKDNLFRHHSQTPLPASQVSHFRGLRYWPFQAEARVTARFEPSVHRHESPVPSSRPFDSDEATFSDAGSLHFTYNGLPQTLTALWLHGYAGGLFVPFKDETTGHESYGGGRYILDTSKGADTGPGSKPGTLILDFNYAYNPSCVYDPRWSCPLSPPGNSLKGRVEAGEQAWIPE